MALLTSIKGGQLAGLPSQGRLSCAKKKLTSTMGGQLAPRDLQDRVQEHTSSRSFDRVQEGGQRLHVTLLTILRSCTGAPPRTVWPSRIKER